MTLPPAAPLADLAKNLVLGALLEDVIRRFGGYELVAHWQQGEFHHDVVIELPRSALGAPARVLVVSTNCNGGVKEVLGFDEVPDRRALWAERCGAPSVRSLPASRGAVRTLHWFDPCELLGEGARSELRPEFRRQQDGGGWEPNFHDPRKSREGEGGGCKPGRRS